MNPAEAPTQLRFTNISEAQGLPNNTIYGLRADGIGNIWLSTNFGLGRIDPRTLDAENPVIQRFHRLHGLQGEEFNFGAHYRDRSGKLFFGGATGFNAFYPEVLEFNERPPRVVLTQFLKLNEPGVSGVPEERIENVSLSHKEDVITLKFAALDFADPRANRYEYKLEGFDHAWVRADERRAATYTNLPGGHYVFRVRASNSDGVWSTQDLALPIDVAPSPWLSTWAYIAYCVLALLMLLAVWYAQQRKIARAAAHRAELEQQVSDRTYELAERYRELQDANRRLEMASYTDTLTGLANRRYLMQHFPQLLAKHQGSQGLAIMIIDLDALKPINDQHGHAARRRTHRRSGAHVAPGHPSRRRAGALGRRRIRGGRACAACRTRHHAGRAHARTRRQDEMCAAARRGGAYQLFHRPDLPALRAGRYQGRELGTCHQDRGPGAVPRQARPQCLAGLVRYRIGGHAAVGDRGGRVQRR